MRNLISITILAVILIGCSCSKNLDLKIDQDYYSDLASENNRIAGDLSLDYFDDDLSNLTYDYYLSFTTDHEAPSAKGFSTIVKNADHHFFKAEKDYFILGLYYKDARTIICDNSNTAILDSVKTYGEGESIPELREFVKSLLNNKNY